MYEGINDNSYVGSIILRHDRRLLVKLVASLVAIVCAGRPCCFLLKIYRYVNDFLLLLCWFVYNLVISCYVWWKWWVIVVVVVVNFLIKSSIISIVGKEAKRRKNSITNPLLLEAEKYKSSGGKVFPSVHLTLVCMNNRRDNRKQWLH